MEISELKDLSASSGGAGILGDVNSAFAAYHKQMNTYNELVRPSIQRAVQGMNSLQPALQSAYSMLKQHEGTINSAIRAAAGVGMYTNAVARAISDSSRFHSIIEHVASAQSLAAEYQRILKADASIYDVTLQEFKIESALKRMLSDLESLSISQSQQGMEINGLLVDTEEDHSTNADKGSLSSIEYIQEEIRAFRGKHPVAQKAIILRVLIFTIIPLLLTLYQMYENETSREISQLRTAIESTLKDVREDVSRLELEMESQPLYETRRVSPISRVQKYTGEQVGCLTKGDLVEVLEFKGKWVFVSVYSADDECSGWVLKKYLRRIPPLKIEHALYLPLFST